MIRPTANRKEQRAFRTLARAGMLILALWMVSETGRAQEQTVAPGWRHLSSKNGDLPVPNAGNQQTSSVVFDIDGDGVNDFIITERTQAPSVTWFRRGADGWTRYVLDSEPLRIEAGSVAHDVDGDGDLDLVAGGDAQSNEVWWWENPAPDFDPDTPWQRRLIKRSGENKHHDQIFADVDGDGRDELIFWNQGGRRLYLAEIPDDPRNTTGEWDLHVIYAWTAEEMEQRGTYPGWKRPNEHEGLALADIDGDGRLDIVGAGRWFKHAEGKEFVPHLIDAGYAFSRSAVGQFIEGGRPEVVLVAGDGAAPMVLYAFRDGTWVGKVLLDELQDGHSIAVADFNGDGHLDLFTAEMQLGQNPSPRTMMLLGDSRGNFRIQEIHRGFGLHEAKLADLDGDGDLDILGKPYTWEAPRLDVWLNEGFPAFEYHRIDNIGRQLGQTALTDVDNDGDLDWIAGQADRAGGEIWWWEYQAPDLWVRHLLGKGNTDVGGAAYDVNDDGWVDVVSGSRLLLNTGNPRSEPFEAYDVGTTYSHDTEFADIDGDGKMDLLANWDEAGLFWYEIPEDPTQPWVSHLIASSEDHKIHGGVSPHAAGDIDGDGDNDVVTGQGWYENTDGAGRAWRLHREIDFGEVHQYGLAVRTWVGDLDRDGDVDVVQAEADNPDGRVAWFENDGSGSFTRHIIKDKGERQDFHSLAVADFDLDGDLDVFSGGGPLSAEGQYKSYIWENRAGPKGRPTSDQWVEHVVAGKPIHEAVAADVDGDGDIDIVGKPWSTGDEHFYLRNMAIERRSR